MKPLIIFHADCPDGFGAAWWLGKALGEHDKHPGRYDEQPPDCSGREVWMVDFCYKTAELARVGDQCQTLTIFDHHASQVAEVDGACIRRHDSMFAYCDLAELGGLDKREAVFDLNHSGVGLADQYVKRWRGWKPPDWFANIEDRDLWHFKERRTQAVFAAVTARPYTDEAWDQMGDMLASDLAREGAGIEMYRQRLIEATLATAFQGVLDGHLVWMAAAPYAICSDVASELAQRDPALFAATFVQYGDGRKYSLRSLEGGMDVSKVAQRLDPTGGGHVHAAGARVKG